MERITQGSTVAANSTQGAHLSLQPHSSGQRSRAELGVPRTEEHPAAKLGHLNSSHALLCQS